MRGEVLRTSWMLWRTSIQAKRDENVLGDALVASVR
jgi:hypothetical protein